MSDIPLTPEQGIFAAENHGLVLKFLNENHLPEDEYYDIVIFGYLNAVKNYFSRPDLRQYSFSTIAWRSMQGDLSNYRKMQNRKKHHANVVSIRSYFSSGDFPMEYTAPYSRDTLSEQEALFLLHDLAGLMSKEQMNMVRMRSNGYDIREIARRHDVTMKCVRHVLELASETLRQLCYEY